MTTLVVVDAHAGWPVEVTLEHGEPSQEKREEVRVVDPNQTAHFYIHSGCTIKGIRELDRPAEPMAVAGSARPVTEDELKELQS